MIFFEAIRECVHHELHSLLSLHTLLFFLHLMRFASCIHCIQDASGNGVLSAQRKNIKSADGEKNHFESVQEAVVKIYANANYLESAETNMEMMFVPLRNITVLRLGLLLIFQFACELFIYFSSASRILLEFCTHIIRQRIARALSSARVRVYQMSRQLIVLNLQNLLSDCARSWMNWQHTIYTLLIDSPNRKRILNMA